MIVAPQAITILIGFTQNSG